MSDLVSVIIPVYNLEDYIGNCLKSVLCQTYKNIEVICVDDGSTDSSAHIIKTLASTDPRIVYVYQNNAGVSAARNKGLDIANGDYVIFVDGDDYIHYQTVEKQLLSLEQSECSIAVSRMLETNLTDCQQEILDVFEFEKIDIKSLFQRVDPICLLSCCAKMFSRKLISDHRFNENITRSEDTIFFFTLLKEQTEVCFTDDVLYFYYLRAGSVTRVGFKPDMIPTLNAYSALCDELAADKAEDILLQLLVFMFKYLFVLRTLAIGTDYEKDVSDNCKKVGNKWIKVLLLQKNISYKEKVLFLLFLYSRPLYELARLLKDPTMMDFYIHRRKL